MAVHYRVLKLVSGVQHDPAGLLCEGSQQVEGLVVAGLDLEDVTVDPLGRREVAGGSSAGAFEESTERRRILVPAPRPLPPGSPDRSRRRGQFFDNSRAVMAAAVVARTTS